MELKTEELVLPGFGGNTNTGIDYKKYRVRYLKVEVGEPQDIATLEDIETRGISTTDIVIINKDKFTFMDKYFLIVTYLEKRD